MKSEDKIKKKQDSAKQEKSFISTKWYVNLDQDMNTFKVNKATFLEIRQDLGPYGPNMPIDVTLHSNNTNNQYMSKWSLKSDPGNTKVAEAGPGIVETALAHKERKEERTMGSDQSITRRIFKNSLKLPDIGGDKHTVICTKKNPTKHNREILQVEVETWRRLWFTVFWTDDAQKGVIDDVSDIVQSAYKDSKIDFVHVPAESKLNCDHKFFTVVSSDKVNEDFVKALHGGQFPALKRKPFHLQIVMVKSCVKLKETDIKIKVLANPFAAADTYKIENSLLTVKLPQDKELMLSPNLVDQVAQVRPNYKFFNSVKSIKFKVGLQPEVIVAPTEKNVIFKSSKEFSFDMTGTIDQFMGMDEVDLDFKLEVADVSVAGQNKGNKIVIETHKFKDGMNLKKTDEIAKILIHEIGHAVDLVRFPDAHWKHKNHYTAHGGMGPHCSYNAKLDGQQIYSYGGQGKMCVMYHQVHDDAGPEFCEDCLKSLKFTKLRSAHLSRPGPLGGWTFSS